MPSQISVDTAALGDAASVLSKSLAALEDARAAVAATASAAALTPADGACHDAVTAATRTTDSMHETCEQLSTAVRRAAANYSTADSASTVCRATGG